MFVFDRCNIVEINRITESTAKASVNVDLIFQPARAAGTVHGENNFQALKELDVISVTKHGYNNLMVRTDTKQK